MLEWLVGPFTRRWAWARTALRVQERFTELHGGSLAAAITLAAFLSLFPLLLAFLGVVGFFSLRVPDFPSRVVAFLGLTGEGARIVTAAIARAEESRRVASLLGFAGLLWSGLGLIGALQRAFDSVWQVSGRGLRDRLFGLGWLAGAGALLLTSVALTGAARLLPGPAAPATILASLLVSVALWMWTFRVITNRDVGWRPLLPGAVLAAVGLEVLKIIGTFALPAAIARSSALYGTLGAMFAVLSWLLVFGRLAVYAAVLNVVRWEEVYGTVTAEIELPRVPGAVPLVATRAGEAATPATSE